MRCPFCGSNQTNHYFFRPDWLCVECANCDREYEGPSIPADLIDEDMVSAFNAYRAKDAARRRGR